MPDTLESLGFEPEATPRNYDTPLAPADEQKFQAWKQKFAPNDSGADYDLRGAYKAGLTPDPARGHWPDTFKKPNHPTFSDQSQYSGKDGNVGGHWGDDNSFTPSATNLQQHSPEELQQYFKKTEPGSKLQLSLNSFGFEPETPDPIHANPQHVDELPTQEQFDQAHQSMMQRIRASLRPALDKVSQVNEAAKPYAEKLNQLDERVKAAAETPIAPLLQNVLRPPTQYVEAAPTTTPGKIAQGVGEAATHFGEGLTTPESLALLAGTGGLSMLPKIGSMLPKAVSIYFGSQMLKTAIDKVPEVRDAIKRGDAKAAADGITTAVLSGALAVGAGVHAAGEATPVTEPRTEINTPPEAVHSSVDAGMQALGFEPEQPAAAQPPKAGSTPPPDVAEGVLETGSREAQLEVQARRLKELGFEPEETAQKPAQTEAAAEPTSLENLGFEPDKPADIPAAAEPLQAEKPSEVDAMASPPTDPLAGTIAEIPTGSIKVDPERFQFKQDAIGKGGVTDKLSDVTKWDPDLAGLTHVWRDPEDNETYAVNGHHRVDLANRLEVPSLAVRYLDASSAEEARTQGALINIAEGNGSAIDAAKVFRDANITPEDLAAKGVSIKGEKASQGMALAKLDPFLFRKVVDGDLPVERAALIGGGLENPNDQRGLYDLLEASEKNGKRLTNGTVGEMIRMANAETPKVTETQTDLFGDHEAARSLIKEKGEVSDYVRSRLAQEKRLFTAVSTDKAAARLGDTGNVIQAGDNAQVAQRTAQAQALYDKLSTSSGQVSDSLNAAARQIADGARPNDVKERAYAEIKRGLIEQATALTGGKAPRDRGAGEAGASRSREAGEGQPGFAGRPDAAGDSGSTSGRSDDVSEKPSLFGDFFKDESGTSRVGEIAKEAAGKFAERDIKPAAIKVAAAWDEAKDTTLRLVAPNLRGDAAELTGLTLRERMAQFARRYDQARQRMKDAWQFFDQRSADDNYAFMDDVERGLGRGGNPSAPANNGLEPIARVLARGLDQRRGEVQQLGEGALERFYVNYFPHMFEKPERVPEFVDKFFGGKANLEGPGSFLKRREFPTMKDARAAGLKPISDNPIDLMLAKIREMDRYLLAHNTLRDLAERGIAKRVSPADAPDAQMDLLGGAPLKKEWTVASRKELPPSFVSIHDPIGGGKWFADEGAAQVLNNYLVPGLRAKSGAYRIALGINNSMNQANLGLSAFHMTGEALRSVMNRSALGMKDLFQGQPVRGSIRIVTSPAGPFLDYLQGDKGSREWFKPGSEGAPIAAMIDNLMRGGARAATERDYINNAVASMKREARLGNYGGAALRVIPAFFDATSSLLMNHLVPRIKLGAAMQMAEQEIGRLPASANVDDVRRVMAKVWDSADNRMGQMVYDNLFLNKTLKDAAHLGIRAVGWDLGTVREFGGGAVDAANLLRGKKPVTYDRIAYTMSAAMTTAIAGALYQYLHTGQGPQQVKDYFFPKREDGARYSFPTDIKDVYHYATAPVRTIENKTGPLLNTVLGLMNNRDFYDRPIREEDDPAYKQGVQVLHYLGRQMLPFTVQPAAGKQKLDDPNLEHRIENYLGVGRASGDLQDNQKTRRGKKSPY